MPLDVRTARRVYDRLGRVQDTQGFYENAALSTLTRRAMMSRSRSLFELGCGTGRYAARLLADTLPAEARYVGVDVSPKMVDLSRARLATWRARADVRLLDPPARSLPGDDGQFDRFVATYVFDLLAVDDSLALLAEAKRLLAPDGHLAFVSLTHGPGRISRTVSHVWDVVAARWPVVVGGCRPLDVRELLDSHDWTVEHHEIVTSWGVPSQVLVAAPCTP